MIGFRGRARRTPAQSEKRGSVRAGAPRRVQTKALLEVPLRLVFVWGRLAELIRVVPCGMVAARAEEEKRARPKYLRWRSIWITGGWCLGERAYW